LDWMPFRDRKTTASLEERRGNRVGVRDGQKRTKLEKLERKLRIIPGSRATVRERKAVVHEELESLRVIGDLNSRLQRLTFSVGLSKRDAFDLESNLRSQLIEELYDNWAGFGGFPFEHSVAVAMVEPSVPAIPFVSLTRKQLSGRKRRTRGNTQASCMASAGGGKGALSWDTAEAVYRTAGEHDALDGVLSSLPSIDAVSGPVRTPADITVGVIELDLGTPVPSVVPISTSFDSVSPVVDVGGQEQSTSLTPGRLASSQGASQLSPDPASGTQETRIFSSGTISFIRTANVAERQTGQHLRDIFVAYDEDAMESIERGFVRRCELIQNWLEYYSELLDDLYHDDRNREWEVSEIWKEFTSEVADHLGLSSSHSARGCRVCVFDLNIS